MSNNVLGTVYSGIIEDVINSSRVDFEESGVDESVIETLREVWHKKLTQLNVAAFPWDPAPNKAPAPRPPSPAPPPVAAPAPPIHPPQPGHYSQAHLTPAPALPLPVLTDPGNNNGVHIKLEPDLDIKQESGNRQHEAASRAAQNLKSAYGNLASSSIQAIHRGQPAKPGQPVIPPAIPGQSPGQSFVPLPPMPQMQQPHPSQTDGAVDGDDEDDWDAVMMRRGPDGKPQELGRVQIDRMMHAHIMSHAKAMGGGGVMVPLEEATRHRTGRGSRSKRREECAPGQFDGEDDDDEDAINSDLDDPDDKSDTEDNEDDGGLGNIMLCMYDKVARVKNKWKCTLKDGVLTVNGKEYVFHKATGEYEW